ncbi:ATP-binding cassette domain-containing protein [Bradyrhizobium sp. LMG 9283]|uniref:ATP-binding cassette domain-containing protein n=1 Tax=Bradyrhizobium sp. LMG 9283 TaxID=592064 RepID=UPI00388E44D4
MSAVLEVSGLTRIFTSRKGPFGLFGRRELRAVDDVSFAVARGRTFCLVGESGCGKTTIGRMIVRLLQPTAGSVRINGEDFGSLSGETLRKKRRQVQMVFQDPYACLNSRMTAAEIVEEPLLNFGIGDANRDGVRSRGCSIRSACPNIFAHACRIICRAGSGSASASRGRSPQILR